MHGRRNRNRNPENFILRFMLKKNHYRQSANSTAAGCQHYHNPFRHSYYEKLGYKKGLCPNAEKYYNEVMSIPLYYGLTDDDVEDVIHAVKKVVAYYTKLK